MIEIKIDKYLNEANDSTDDFVKGVKSWLDQFKEAYSYNNFKLAKEILNNIEKKIKKIKKEL